MKDINIRPEAVKLLEKIGKYLDHSLDSDIFAYDTKNKDSKSKKRRKKEKEKKGPIKKFLHSKGNKYFER